MRLILILAFFAVLLFLGCSSNANRNDSNDKETSDSTFALISKGRDIKKTIEERRNFLKKAYKKTISAPNDSIKAKYFSRLSLAYFRLDDSLLFRKTNKETIAIAKKTQDSTVQAEAHWDIASFLRDNGVPDSAYYHFAQAQKIYSGLNDNFYAGRMLYSMAGIQEDIEDYTGSEITTIRAIALLKPLETNDKYRHLYNCYNNLGIVTNNLREYRKAIEYHNIALEYSQKTNRNNILQYNTFNNIGVVYQQQGNHKEAVIYFQRVLDKDSLFIKNTMLYAKALNNLYYNKFKIGEKTEVESNLIKALNIRDSIFDFRGLSESYYDLAQFYLEQKDTTKSLKNANKANFFARKSSNNGLLLETLELLSAIDIQNINTHTQNYFTLNDSLQQAERRIRNKFALIEYETDEVKEKNALLAKQQQLWIGISIGLFFLALFIVLSIYQRIRNQKLRFEQQQQASNQEIFDLMLNQKEQIKEGKQAEQKRISEELHDGIVGQMAGIRLMFIGLNKRKDEKSVEHREDLIKKLQETEEEIRTISHELNHASYQKIHNFINSIQDLLDSTGSVAGIENNFYYNQETDWDDLSGEIKINLYRIVQESLQNCVKYAKASNILLDFDTNENGIKIVISDNGVGFDTKKGKKGIGLKNIQSRVKKLNGTWEISSKIGEGTTTTIEIPRVLDELTSTYPLKKVL